MSLAEISLKSNFRGKTQPYSRAELSDKLFMKQNRSTAVNERKAKDASQWSSSENTLRLVGSPCCHSPTWQTSRRVNSRNTVSFHFRSSFFFFCHAEVCKLLETDERGDAAQSDTVQRQDKYGFEVMLTLIRLTNPALKSTWASACLRALFGVVLLLRAERHKCIRQENLFLPAY